MIIYDKNDKYLVIPTGLGNLNTGVTDGDVDPCEGLYENGYEDGYDTGFDEGKTEGTAEGYERGKTEGVAEYKNSLEPLTATENRIYRGIYKDVYVEVPQMIVGGKKYRDGTVDVDGLRAIGWDDESIQMLQDNTNFYAWQNEEWEVDDYSKSLYGVINSDNTSDYDYENSPKFLPMIDTSNVTNMSVFIGDYYNTIGIPKLDTSNVTNMQSMFENCTSLTTIPQLDTSNVTHMLGLFGGCTNLTTIPQLDTSNVTDMQNMFGSCKSLTSLPELDCTNVTHMKGFLGGYSAYNSLTEIGGFINLKANLDLSYCPNLTYDSCKYVLSGLYLFARNGETPNSNQGKLTVHANFKNAFDESAWESIMDLITSDFGWTIIVK